MKNSINNFFIQDYIINGTPKKLPFFFKFLNFVFMILHWIFLLVFFAYFFGPLIHIDSLGKTFFSINVATVFALSGKKTFWLGLDLRKPKIFGDFKIKNDISVNGYFWARTDYYSYWLKFNSKTSDSP